MSTYDWSNWDFISKFVEARDTQLHTDCVREYFEYGGLFIVSTLAKRNFFYLPDTQKELFVKPGTPQKTHKFFLNIFVMLLGKSRVSRRTSQAIRHCKQAIRSAEGTEELEEEYERRLAAIEEALEQEEQDAILDNIKPKEQADTIDGTDKLKKKKKKKLPRPPKFKSIILPDDFTPQRLKEKLHAQYKPDPNLDNPDPEKAITQAVWVKDECGGWFMQVQKQDFMATADTEISQYYDCEDYVTETLKRGRERAKNLYMTALLSGTDQLPKKLFTEDMLRQGFLNRFIFVPIFKKKEYRPQFIREEDRKSPPLPPFYQWCRALYNKREVTPLMLTSPALKLYLKFEKNIEDKILSEDLGLKESYLGNLPNIVLKLAGLYSISRMSIPDIETSDSFAEKALVRMVEEQDMLRAIQHAHEIWNFYLEILSMMKEGIPNIIRTDEPLLQKILEHVPPDGSLIPHTKLLQLAHLKKTPFSENIETLRERGQIEVTDKNGKVTLIRGVGAHYRRKLSEETNDD